MLHIEQFLVLFSFLLVRQNRSRKITQQLSPVLQRFQILHQNLSFYRKPRDEPQLELGVHVFGITWNYFGIY